MPIDLLSTVKKTSHFAFSSPLLNNVLGSSLFVSIIVALIMVLLVMIMYPAQKNTPFSVICKMFLYMFLGSIIVVFLHDGVIKCMLQEEIDDRQQEDFMRGVIPTNRDQYYGQQQVRPNLSDEQMMPINVEEQEEKSVVEGGGHDSFVPKHVPPKIINPYK